ncbi:hypothetical protein O6H91_12G041700 [Diphasiastrum complanatum]|uniref:Uncharacterized protein n=1 Tax=Diphasiastrum complanatum TaxID=34168 RepID=A0ACC2C0X0_DIPCM|nr:hypothetical protein O6H91_12G041700 [Diphasiastrum complanatum]
MATRNRTTLFRKYRDALREVHSSGVGSSSAADKSLSGPVIELVSAPFFNLQGGGQRGYNALSTTDPDTRSQQTGAVVVGLPPAWVDVSEMVAVDMQKARTKMSELVKAHARALMPTFDDSKGQEQNIELLTKEITQLLKKSEKNLQQLSQGQGPNEDVKLRKNVQRFLASDLQSLSMEFRKQQKLYLQKLRQQQDGSSGMDIGLNLNGHRPKGSDDELFDPGFSDQQMLRLKKSEVMTEEREKELQQIMESANDLSQIMKDLSLLVIDQGTIVDRIDYNIQNVASTVEQGVRQLEKAEKTQKKGGMVLCVMILIGLCLFMIFVLIFKKLVL